MLIRSWARTTHPRLQVTLSVSFSTGLLSAAAAVLGAGLAGPQNSGSGSGEVGAGLAGPSTCMVPLECSPWSLVVAISVIAAVLAGYLWQVRGGVVALSPMGLSACTPNPCLSMPIHAYPCGRERGCNLPDAALSLHVIYHICAVGVAGSPRVLLCCIVLSPLSAARHLIHSSDSTLLPPFWLHLWQAYRLVVFYRCHNDQCWHPTEAPQAKDEVDDPAFAFLTNVTRGLIRPASRELGGFEPPEEDAEEPGRTERALARFFTCHPVNARRMRPGDALVELQTWLGDASGSVCGTWYLFGTITIQLTSALIVGVAYSLAWSQTAYGNKVRHTLLIAQCPAETSRPQHPPIPPLICNRATLDHSDFLWQVLLGVVLTLQLTMAWWSVSRTANDKIDGFEKCAVSLMEAVSTCLVLAASFLADREEGEPVDMERLARALELSALSVTILMGAIFLPMAITVCACAISPPPFRTSTPLTPISFPPACSDSPTPRSPWTCASTQTCWDGAFNGCSRCVQTIAASCPS